MTGSCLALCSHSSRISLLSSLLPSPPPSPCRHWELGERAWAQLASKITLCCIRCLHAHQSGGKGQGPCNVTLWCQKNQGCSGNYESTFSQTKPLFTDCETLWHLQRSCPNAISLPFPYYALHCSVPCKKMYFTCTQNMFCNTFPNHGFRSLKLNLQPGNEWNFLLGSKTKM